jgi:hypothetical protein
MIVSHGLMGVIIVLQTMVLNMGVQKICVHQPLTPNV